MSTKLNPRDRRPAPEDNRTDLQKALDDTAEATTAAAQAMAEAAQWRIAYEYGLEE